MQATMGASPRLRVCLAMALAVATLLPGRPVLAPRPRPRPRLRPRLRPREVSDPVGSGRDKTQWVRLGRGAVLTHCRTGRGR